MSCQVHPSSIVDDGATIGDGTQIWHFSHVCASASVGERCVIGQNVFVGPRAVIGNRVRIQNNVSVYEGVRLDDDVFCGPSVVFTNVINPRAFIARKHEFRQTRVGRGASLGANCTIVCGVSIGAFAMVGASAVVTRDVRDHELVVGNPARHLGWVSRAGMRLRFDEGEVVQARCPESGDIYVLEGGTVRPLV
jgi:UDP-2-acetamido-3-amino-2,3-dideoxy-glucuronate N-acetyltransferase